ncbi:FlgO family outer membrane protein [Corallincola platygyrae]|uniref:FlgO family outer membrane protein n=1 Tax=Corallincola platygyrae TaxID=1193278 RepID=A0ABW4XLH9_9GAMM
MAALKHFYSHLLIGAGLLLIVLALSSCSMLEDEEEIYVPHAAVTPMTVDLPTHVKQLALQLIGSSRYVSSKTPIAVTSFVDIETLESTDVYGNQLSELVMVELQQMGWTLIDFKLTGGIDVTPTGDFAMTRDFLRLQHRHPIEYILTGTLIRGSNGIQVTARIVGVESRAIVATASTFLPMSLFVEQAGMPAEGGYVAKDPQSGMLIRKGG